MRIVIYKLDNPGNKYDWWKKDVEISSIDDLFMLNGVCANNIYAELYDIRLEDDPDLIAQAKKFLSDIYPYTARKIIDKYYKLLAQMQHQKGDHITYDLTRKAD